MGIWLRFLSSDKRSNLTASDEVKIQTSLLFHYNETSSNLFRVFRVKNCEKLNSDALHLKSFFHSVHVFKNKGKPTPQPTQSHVSTEI